MYCKICGSEINDQAVVCPKCGCSTKVSAEAEVSAPQKRKLNVLCLVGFVLSLVSLFIALFGAVAITGLILSIVGLVQANKNNESLKGLGIAGIVVSAGSLIYTIVALITLATLL